MKKVSILFVVFFISVFSLASATTKKTINLFLSGTGTVGKELLHQIHGQFSSEAPINVRVVGIANSKWMCFDAAGIALDSWESEHANSTTPMSIDGFVDEMVRLALPCSVFVDCTSNQSIADAYPKILQSKISVVTPNKKANSGSFSSYSTLRNIASEGGVKFLYDSNVGAGLPFIKTIQSLKRSGDSIVKLEAVLSGTLSYLFNSFDGSVPFSAIVREAQRKGYTEPDPRDDLNGLDMARKFLILARESGLTLEMSDIIINPFLSQQCFEASSVDDFYKKLEDFDAEFSALAKTTYHDGKVLRFIGTLENGKAILSLKAVGRDHPFYTLSDTDNIGSIHSNIYSKNPIVIKGPGAGASVTAANVLSNIIETGL